MTADVRSLDVAAKELGVVVVVGVVVTIDELVDGV